MDTITIHKVKQIKIRNCQKNYSKDLMETYYSKQIEIESENNLISITLFSKNKI